MSDEAEVLDLTDEVAPGPLPRPVFKAFNLEEAQEQVRGRIAGGLLLLLGVVVVISLSATCLRHVGKDDQSAVHLEELLKVIYGPLIALVSAATGFYFGGGKSTK